MATFDGNIVVNIALDSPPVDEQNFGTMLIAGDTMTAGFTERIRRYSNPTEASNDADLSSALIDRVTAAFAQLLRPTEVAVGRVDGAVAENSNVDITAPGVATDTHTVTVLGQSFVHTTPGGETNADIVDALIILINAAGLPVTLTDNGDDFDIDADNAGQPLGVTYVATGSAAGAATTPTPAVTVDDELQAILAVDQDWYGIVLESRDYWDIEEAAIFAEANERLFIAQSNDADVLTTANDDIASTLMALGYAKTSYWWHSDNLEFLDVALCANRLTVDPDEAATTWAYVRLVGVTANDNAITSTALANLRGKNGNTYLTAKGTGVTSDGKVAAGEFIDIVTTADWLSARLAEDVTQTLINYANRGEKVPYTEAGFEVFAALIRNRADQGVKIDHFVENTLEMSVPTLAGVSAADRAARRVTLSFSVEPAGAVHFPTINGFVTIAS